MKACCGLDTSILRLNYKCSCYLELSEQVINILTVLAHYVTYVPSYTGHACQDAVIVNHLSCHRCVYVVTNL